MALARAPTNLPHFDRKDWEENTGVGHFSLAKWVKWKLALTAPKYVHGFRLFDCVKYQDKICFVFGRRNSGYFDLRTLDGTKISASASYKKLTVVQRAAALLVERRRRFLPQHECMRVSRPRF